MNNYQNPIIPKITEMIYKERERFPQAQLVDIYKLFHQDYFGPGHFFSDKAGIIRYLTLELDMIKDRGNEPENQDISCLNNFLRVDIRWINKNKISLEDLTEMFWESSRIDLHQPVSWYFHWQQIIRILENQFSDFNLERGKELSKFALENQALHHSEIFREIYHPHYRIISKELWKFL